MKNVFRAFVLLITSLTLGGCYYAVDSVQEYTQRADTITLSAGDAQEVNSRIQMIDPWPRYVGNSRIPISGERMAGAVERYRDVSKLPTAPRPLSLGQTSTVVTGGGATGQ